MFHFILISVVLAVLVHPFSEAYNYYEASIPRRHQLDKGVRFGYQNPIRVAPTLPPVTFSTVNYERDNDFYPATSTRRQPISNLRCDPKVDRNGRIIHSRIDRRTQQCVQLESIESCGRERNMAFYALPSDEIYGECDCIKTSRRPLVYHEKTDTCYFVYQQAYCSESKWLVIENGKPNCQDNPCRTYGSTELGWDWTQNTDVLKMNTRGIVPIIDKMQCVPLGSTCEADGSFKLPGIAEIKIRTPVLKFRIGDLEPGCHPI